MPKDGLHLEVDAHRGDEGGCEAIVGVAEEEAGLAHAGVADDEELEHVVEVLIGGILLPLGVSAAGHCVGLKAIGFCKEKLQLLENKYQIEKAGLEFYVS